MFGRDGLTGPILFDGGMGTLLLQKGLSQGRAPESWLVENPDAIEEAQRLYVEAGADIIQTCTFGATPAKLAASGFEGQCRDMNRRAVVVARKASAGRTLVAGNIGPTGLMMEPMGSASEEDITAQFAEQASALADAGVDLLNIETMFDVREALCAVRVACSTGLPVIASMTFDRMEAGHFTIMGDPIGPSLISLREAGADVVGMNCTVAPEMMVPMVSDAIQSVGGLIIAQPNAGTPRQTAAGTEYDSAPIPFAEALRSMIAEGAAIVGGCCGTTPDFIREARRALDDG